MRALLLLATMVSALLPGRAIAAVRLCVEVRAPNEPDAEKLVRDELAHHPSHVIVDEGCQTQLFVELFTVAGIRFVTLRLNRDVPVRFEVKNAHELDEKIGEGLRQVLRHDPVYLSEDLSRLNRVWREGATLLKRGTNRYRLELFELMGTAGKNAFFASGGAFSVARSSSHLQVFARLHLAGAPSLLADDAATLRVVAGGALGALWEASARSSATFYLGPAVGLHYMRFEGRNGVSPANTVLLTIGLRAGVRVLRWYNFDLDLFAEAHLPLYKTVDPDSPLVSAYTPFGALGVGVGF